MNYVDISPALFATLLVQVYFCLSFCFLKSFAEARSTLYAMVAVFAISVVRVWLPAAWLSPLDYFCLCLFGHLIVFHMQTSRAQGVIDAVQADQKATAEELAAAQLELKDCLTLRGIVSNRPLFLKLSAFLLVESAVVWGITLLI